jgi:hypothetical protein
LAQFSNPKFILMSLLISFAIFISFSKSSSFYIAISSHLHTASDFFSSQLRVLVIHNQLCLACVLSRRVIVRLSPVEWFSSYPVGFLLHYISLCC